MNVLHLKRLVCVIEIYRYSFRFPTSCSEYEGVSLEVTSLRVSSTADLGSPHAVCVLVWIVKALVCKYINRRQKKAIGHQDQKGAYPE